MYSQRGIYIYIYTHRRTALKLLAQANKSRVARRRRTSDKFPVPPPSPLLLFDSSHQSPLPNSLFFRRRAFSFTLLPRANPLPPRRCHTLARGADVCRLLEQESPHLCTGMCTQGSIPLLPLPSNFRSGKLSVQIHGNVYAHVCACMCVYTCRGCVWSQNLELSGDKEGYLVDWRRNSTSFWKFFPIEGRRNHVEIEMKTEIEILFVHRVNISSEFSKQRRSMEIWKKKKEITVSFRRVRRAKTRASRERNPG